MYEYISQLFKNLPGLNERGDERKRNGRGIKSCRDQQRTIKRLAHANLYESNLKLKKIFSVCKVDIAHWAESERLIPPPSL